MRRAVRYIARELWARGVINTLQLIAVYKWTGVES